MRKKRKALDIRLAQLKKQRNQAEVRRAQLQEQLIKGGDLLDHVKEERALAQTIFDRMDEDNPDPVDILDLSFSMGICQDLISQVHKVFGEEQAMKLLGTICDGNRRAPVGGGRA